MKESSFSFDQIQGTQYLPCMLIDETESTVTLHLPSSPVIPKSGPQAHNMQVIDSPEQVIIHGHV